jgi:L-aminopeptidase/D-esterase-like protein
VDRIAATVSALHIEIPSSDRLSIPGFTLGHGTDTEAMTGVTVILCPEGATAAADVRGTATGTRQFDSLRIGHSLNTLAHGVVLAGGSTYGLSCTDPVLEYLEQRGHGLETGFRRVPVVPTAILFDLGFGAPDASPSPALVEAALESAAAGRVSCGSVGAGTGATVGKVSGRERSMKGGFGFASFTFPGGPTVAAAVAVNAYGTVRDPHSGVPVAGARVAADSHELLDGESILERLDPGQRHPWESNTTLAVVMTDARLSKSEARKVCEMAFGGLYRTLSPALTLYDGDLVVTLSLGEVAAHIHQVGALAQRAVAEAILVGVREANGFGQLPAVRDLGG